MAYIEPKTNWVSTNIPVASDLNRIEGNTKQNHDDIAAGLAEEAVDREAAIDAEESARISAVNAEEAARIADVNAEEAARIAQIAELKNLDAIGSFAFCVIPTSISPGATVAGSLLKYASADGNVASSPTPSGTWRCMGYSLGGAASSTRTTLFVRIS